MSHKAYIHSGIMFVSAFKTQIKIRKRRFSVDNLVIGVQLADVSTRCSSHLQGKVEARCENAEAL